MDARRHRRLPARGPTRPPHLRPQQRPPGGVGSVVGEGLLQAPHLLRDVRRWPPQRGDLQLLRRRQRQARDRHAAHSGSADLLCGPAERARPGLVADHDLPEQPSGPGDGRRKVRRGRARHRPGGRPRVLRAEVGGGLRKPDGLLPQPVGHRRVAGQVVRQERLGRVDGRDEDGHRLLGEERRQVLDVHSGLRGKLPRRGVRQGVRPEVEEDHAARPLPHGVCEGHSLLGVHCRLRGRDFLRQGRHYRGRDHERRLVARERAGRHVQGWRAQEGLLPLQLRQAV
mmetsp:Transcript_42169/g.111461  ORF Transcript_42169/g.111461 Transcript_42169/m.111461 type:complete len:284 (+) Transcript_42169:1317-2168(+)